MDINSLTIGEAKQLAALFGRENTEHPFEIGANYMIRTVTMIDIGRVVRVTASEIVLKDAAWIADTGRFAQAVKNAEFDEVEPFPSGEVIIGRGAIIDACRITKLDRKQK